MYWSMSKGLNIRPNMLEANQGTNRNMRMQMMIKQSFNQYYCTLTERHIQQSLQRDNFWENMLHTLQNKQSKNIHQLTIKNSIRINKTKPSHQSNINMYSISTKRTQPMTQNTFYPSQPAKIQQLSCPPNLTHQPFYQQNFTKKISIYPKIQEDLHIKTHSPQIYQNKISKSSKTIINEQIKLSQNLLTLSIPNDYLTKHITPKRIAQSHYIELNRKKAINETSMPKSKSFHQPSNLKRGNSLNYKLNRCQKGETIDEEIQQLFQQNLQKTNFDRQPPANKYKQLPPKITIYHKPPQKESRVEKEIIVEKQQKTLLLDSNLKVIISVLALAILILILQTIR